MTKARDLANASTALSAVDATELGYLDGVTSAVQTQLDAKLASSTAATTYVANSLADAKGDIFVASADNTVTRLAVGSTGDTIVADSSTATGLKWVAPAAAGMTNPMTTTGDTIYSSSGSTPARLGIGSTGQVLTVAGGLPSWATPATPTTTKNFTLLNTTTLNGAASYTVTGLSGYDIFYITLDDFSSSAVLFETSIQLNADAANHYQMGGKIINTSNTSGYMSSASTNNTANITIVKGVTTAMAGIMIFGANSAGVKPIQVLSGGTAATDVNGIMAMGRYAGTSVISSIKVQQSSGNFDAGTMRIYGAA